MRWPGYDFPFLPILHSLRPSLLPLFPGPYNTFSNKLTNNPLDGWNTSTCEINKNFHEEVNQAFENVDDNLKTAGGKHWPQVFRINMYLTNMGEEALTYVAENLKKWLPDR
jgi:hypothetical protein